MLRRRYLPEEKAPRKAEKGESQNAPIRERRNPPIRLHRRPQNGGRVKVDIKTMLHYKEQHEQIQLPSTRARA